MQNMLERQLKLEQEYTDKSILRGQLLIQEAVRQNQGTRVPALLKLVQAAYSSSKDAIDKELAQRCAGVGAKYRNYIRTVGSDICISIALRTCINLVFSEKSVSMQTVLTQIGKAVEAEVYIHEISAVNALQAKHAEEYLDRGKVQNVQLRGNAFHAALKYIGDTDRARWDSKTCIQVGKLCCAAAYSSGLFQWVSGKKGMHYLAPSPELSTFWEEVQQHVHPVVHYIPMLVPPVPWTGLHAGGYLSPWWRVHAKACSFRGMPKQLRRPLEEQWKQEQTAELRAVMNKVQEVPYRINWKVLEVLQKGLARGDACMGLAKTLPDPIPTFPFPDDWDSSHKTEQEDAIFRVWKHQMREWYVTEHLRKTRSRSVLGALQTMLRFRNEERIYFPVFLDWRGRLYYRGVLNPQAQDSIKGVLEFAEGKPLGERGLFWLRVHIANCCGYDKTNFEDRAQYVVERERDLRYWYENCLDAEAPDPSLSFQLYAALNAYFEALDSGSPETYKCHIPVAMDATCSGLQHYSTMLRDATGAKYVNCFTSSTEKKEDIYAEVAKRAIASLPDYCDEVQQLYWQEHSIPRSMAKRPVMTFVYGSTLSSSIDYVAQDMLEQGFNPIKDADGNVLVHQGQLAVPVAKALRAAVQSTVPAAASMMQYLQRAVRCQKEPLRWTTPMGLSVINWVDKQLIQRIKIRSMGVEQIVLKQDTGELDTHKAANSIAPNFVHSMDATHMQMLVQRFEHPLLLVHDSFACHASTCDAMHTAIRQAFHDLYSQDIASLIEQSNPEVQRQLQEGNLIKPEYGDFKIEQVLDSVFLFC